jgi:transcriptional regulator with XRE-family HTH domain
MKSNLKQKMQAAGIGCFKLATITGVHPSNISQYANLRSKPNWKTAEKIANVLKCPVNELFPGVEAKS